MPDSSHTLIGDSSTIQRVLSLTERAASSNASVLITGERGTGKELIARIIHHHSQRGPRPFVYVSCCDIHETLFESQLFGFWPRTENADGILGRHGAFVHADGGTLFLDEIDCMPAPLQVPLLNVILQREIIPVGENEPIPVDVRIIAATSSDLRQRVKDGTFDPDLYFFLSTIALEVPPLRERKEDIPVLARHWVAYVAQSQERKVPELSPEFLAALMQSNWPGNVRTLRNYIEHVMLFQLGEELHPDPLPYDHEGKR